MNSLKRYSKGGNGKNEEFDQIWWKVLWHDGKTPRHSGPAWGGPWGILWGKFFFPNFWNFWIFFFSKCSQSGMVNLTNVKFGYVLETTWNFDLTKKNFEISKICKNNFFFIAFCQMAHFEAEYILRIKFKVYHGKVQT